MFWSRVKTWWKGWRTMAGAGLSVFAGFMLFAYDQVAAFGIDLKTLIGDVVPTRYVGVVIIALGAFFGFMRYITTTPVGMTFQPPVPPPLPKAE